MFTGCWWWNLEEREHLENLGVYGRTILKYIFENRMGEIRFDSSGSG
jgi:hypothetical protein